MATGMRVPFRFGVLLATFLLSLLMYIDRIAISTAKEPVADELGLSDTQMGWVLSVFALGYALFQVPGGMLGDRLGARKALAAIVSAWSLFTALTGAVWNFASLLSARFLFGLGEAGAFPCVARTVFSWFPLRERGIVNGINFSGSRIGAAFSLPLMAWMVAAFGWRMTFFILGLVGVVWAVVWYRWFRDEPEDHPYLGAEERAYILGNRQNRTVGNAPALGLVKILSHRNVWLNMGQYFASNFVFFFCLTWLYPYLKEKYALGAAATGLYAMAPLILGAVGNWVSGLMVDILYQHGWWKSSRQLPAVLGFVLTAVGLALLLKADTVGWAVTALAIAVFGADMTLSPSWSFCMDIGRESAGAVSGVMNMAGNFGSFVTALAFPYLKNWTGSDVPFFYTGMVLALLAATIWLFMDPRKSMGNEKATVH